MLGFQALYIPVRHQVESLMILMMMLMSYHVSVHLDKGKVILTNICNILSGIREMV
jgi:hypothetical protein